MFRVVAMSAWPRICLTTPHTCRHTAATKMAASGLPPEVVKQILGHADIATTLNIYTHPDTALLVANLEKIQWR